MKKTIIIFILLCLSLTGCYLIPLEIPTPVATATDSEIQLTETETGEPEDTPTPTQKPSETLAPTETEVVIETATATEIATATETATATYTSTPVPFTLQADSPVYIQNFAHTDAACDWLGVAGQVFGEDGSPQINLVLVVKGTIGQTPIDLTGVTGIPEADIYGPGGYEIVLADTPAQTDDSLSIQVYDLSGNALSDPVSFDTYSDCDKNLVVINFNTQ